MTSTTSTTSTSTPRIDASISVWADEIQREVRRLASKKFFLNEMDADDVASDAVERFLERAEYHMITHQSAVAYARATFKNGCHNWQRRERVQRCQGSDLQHDDDGTVRPARMWVSLDAPVGVGANLYLGDFLVAKDEVERTVVDEAALRVAIDATFNELSLSDRSLLEDVLVDGRNQAEICSELGCTEVALRQRLSRARRAFRQHFPPAAERHLAVVPALTV